MPDQFSALWAGNVAVNRQTQATAAGVAVARPFQPVSNDGRIARGSEIITIALGGVSAQTLPNNVVTGHDITWLVPGTPDNLQVHTINDVNRLPSAGMHSYIRTLDAVNGITSELTTKTDLTPVNAGTTYMASRQPTLQSQRRHTRALT